MRVKRLFFWGLLIVLFVFAFLSFLELGTSKVPLPDQRINDVVRIFMHERDHYSLMVLVPGSEAQFRLVPLRTMDLDPAFYADVSSDQHMWVMKRYKHQPYAGFVLDAIEIHIHSEKDVEGGGWDHGKFGRGRTTVVR